MFGTIMLLPPGHWISALSILGNIISVMVYLAPIPTFCQIYRQKSTQGFQSVPYIVALFSALLWIYNSSLKPNTSLLTVNIIGSFIETIYVFFHLYYAPRRTKLQTVGLLLVVICMSGIIIIFPRTNDIGKKTAIVGKICMVVSVLVFFAPLCVVLKVIRSRNVQYMPFLLSLFLTVSAVIWFFYGLLIKDVYVTVPNVVGFGCGVVQMMVYLIFRYCIRSPANVELPENEMRVIAPVNVGDEASLSSNRDTHLV